MPTQIKYIYNFPLGAPIAITDQSGSIYSSIRPSQVQTQLLDSLVINGVEESEIYSSYWDDDPAKDQSSFIDRYSTIFNKEFTTSTDIPPEKIAFVIHIPNSSEEVESITSTRTNNSFICETNRFTEAGGLPNNCMVLTKDKPNNYGGTNFNDSIAYLTVPYFKLTKNDERDQFSIESSSINLSLFPFSINSNSGDIKKPIFGSSSSYKDPSTGRTFNYYPVSYSFSTSVSIDLEPKSISVN